MILLSPILQLRCDFLYANLESVREKLKSDGVKTRKRYGKTGVKLLTINYDSGGRRLIKNKRKVNWPNWKPAHCAEEQWNSCLVRLLVPSKERYWAATKDQNSSSSIFNGQYVVEWEKYHMFRNLSMIASMSNCFFFLNPKIRDDV